MCADSGAECHLEVPNVVQPTINRPADAVANSNGSIDDNLLDSIMTDFTSSGFRIDRSLAHRFVASLLTKRFVILTGLSGSGKTKLAQAFAAWITSNTSTSVAKQQLVPEPAHANDEWPNVGVKVRADRISYDVDAFDRIAIQFSNERGNDNQRVKVTLPRELIEEWVTCIKANDFSRDTAARTIRELVAITTKYSTQLNSFETHLKAAAFALIEYREEQELQPEQEPIPAQVSFTSQGSSSNLANEIQRLPAAYEIVAVGADWSTSEHILGYADALHTSHYVRTQALNLILRALSHPDKPYFLILDEMNLSHVERYFADVLSTIESGEPIHLYGDLEGEHGTMRDGVPHTIHLPENLFIIGTVNVDETTYMFSPKVLDRANTIEFRIDESQLKAFLDNPSGLNLANVQGKGAHFSRTFLSASVAIEATNSSVVQGHVNSELMLFFNVMAHHGYEFGFRTALEISRFIYYHQLLGNKDWAIQDAIDAQIYQKILPRLNGSRARIEPVLRSLTVLCRSQRNWFSDKNGPSQLVNRQSLLSDAKAAGSSTRLQAADDSFADPSDQDVTPIYPQSATKIRRMYRLVRQNGFTSFAEA